MGHSYDMDWDTKPKLDEARVLAPEVPAHRSRKNTKRWCRGKPGVEHVTEIRPDRWSLSHGGFRCGWQEHRQWRNYADHREYEGTGRWSYSCWHKRVCVICGKILASLQSRECPDYHPKSGR